MRNLFSAHRSTNAQSPSTELMVAESNRTLTNAAAHSSANPLGKLSRWMRRAQRALLNSRIPFLTWLAHKLRMAGDPYANRRLSRLTTLLLLPFVPSLVQALPTGEQVVGGQATIARPTPQTLTVQQSTNKAAIDWRNFNIQRGESVVFNQPNSSSVTLNRVLSADPSQIFGSLRANGSVFLVNNAGVYFAPGASVNVGSFVGSTLSMSNKDFMAGNYRFSNPGNAGSVINEGTISAQPGGYVGLFAPQLINNGVISAEQGSVSLAAGERVTMAMGQNGMLNVNVDAAALRASIQNKGQIIADGGQVALSARASDALLDTVINTSGTIRANSLQQKNGKIILDGGTRGVVEVSGQLSAKGEQAGGSVKVLGDKVGLVGNASIDVSGQTGGGEVLVGGNYQGQGPEHNASVTFVGKDVSIKADALNNGEGGKVIVWADDTTRFSGNISAKGGAQAGNGGLVETSGKRVLHAEGMVDVNAANGKGGNWLLDPFDLTISNSGKTNIDDSTVGTYVSSGTPSYLETSILNAALTGNATITVKTGAGNGNGKLTVDGAVAAAGDASLVLEATSAGGVGSIVFGSSGSISGNTHKLNVTMNSATSIDMAGKSIATGGGDITVSAKGDVELGSIDAAGGNLTISNASGGAITQDGVLKVDTLTITKQSATTTLNLANEISKLGVVDVGGNDINIKTTKALSQSGAMTASTLTLTNTSASSTLDNVGNAITVLGAIDATGQNFSLTNTAALTQTGVLKASSLSLKNTGGNTTLDQSNVIGKLGAVDATGRTFTLKNTTALTQDGALKAASLVLTNTGGNATLDHVGNAIVSLGAVDVSSNTLTLTNTVDLAQSAALKADTLIVTGAKVNLGTQTNVVKTLGAVTTTGDFSLKNGNTNLTANGGISAVGINAVGKDISLNVGTGTLTASGAIKASNLTITADGLSLGGTTPTVTGTVTLAPTTQGTNINLAGGTGFAVDIGTISKLKTTTANVVIGRSDGSGVVTLKDAADFGTSNLTLHGGKITNEGVAGRTITATDLNLNAAGGSERIGDDTTADHAIKVAASTLSVNTNNRSAFVTSNTGFKINASDVGDGILSLSIAGGVAPTHLTQGGKLTADKLAVTNTTGDVIFDTVSNSIVKLNTINVGANAFSLTNNNGGNLGQAASTKVTAGTLNITNTAGNIDLSTNINAISKLGTINASTSHNFALKNSGALTQNASGITANTFTYTSTSGDTNLTAGANNLNALGEITAVGDFSISNNNHDLTNSGTISLGTTHDLSIDVGTAKFTAGTSSVNAQNLTLTGDSMVLENFDGRSSSGNGVRNSITVQPATLSTPIVLGAASSGSGFDLSVEELSNLYRIRGNIATIGHANGTGDIGLSGEVDFGSMILSLRGGKISDGNTTANVITANTVNFVNNSGAIGATGSNNAIDITAANLSVNSTGNSSAYIANTRGFALAASTVGTGTLSVSAGSTSAGITQSGALTAGTLALSNTAGATTLNQTNLISKLGVVNAAGQTFTLKNNAELEQTGSLAASSFAYTNNGAFNSDFSASGNNITGSLGAITVGGNFTFSNGNNALSTGAAINAAGKDVTLKSGTASLTPGAAINAANLTLMSNSPVLTNLTGTISSTITVQPATDGTAINLGGGSGGMTILGPAIAKLKDAAPNIVIGSNTGTGNVTIGDALDFAGKTVTLRGGAMSDGGTTRAITATTVNLQANGGNHIGAGGDEIDVLATNVSAITTGSGNAFIKSANGYKVNASTVGGTLNLTTTSNSGLTQGGVITAGTLAVTSTTGDVNFGTSTNMISNLGTVNVGAKTFTLDNGTAMAQTGALTAGTLALSSTGDTNLNFSGNKVSNLGVVTTSGNFTLANDDYDLKTTAAINAAGHNITLSTGKGTLTVGAGTITAQNLSITADKFALGGFVVALSGAVELQPSDKGVNIFLGGDGGLNTFSLNSELNTLKTSGATSVVIGRSDGTGIVQMLGAIDLGTKPVTLRGGSFNDDAKTDRTITAGTVNFVANTGDIGTSVTNGAIDVLTANISPNTKGGSVYLASTGGFNINTTNAGSGTISLKAGGNITQDGALTAATLNIDNTVGLTNLATSANVIDHLGTITATGQPFSFKNSKVLDQTGALIAGTLEIINTGGSTTLTHSGNKISNLGAVDTSAGGDFTFSNGNNGFSTAGVINAGANTVSLSSGTSSLTAGTAAITAKNLTLTSDDPSIDSLNANAVTDTLTLQPASANKNVSLGTKEAGSFSLTTALTALKNAAATNITIGHVDGTGTVSINSAVDMNGKNLTLRGGSFTDGDTTVKTISANTANFFANSGAIGGSTSNNALDLAVTNLGLTTAGGSAFVTSNTGYKINSSTVGSGTLSLGASGTILQGGAITADTLTVTNTTGDTTLNLATNQIKNLGAITATGRTVAIKNGRDLGQSGALKATILILDNTAGHSTLDHANNAVSKLGKIDATDKTFELRNTVALTQLDTLTADTLKISNTLFDTNLASQANAITHLGEIDTGSKAFALQNTLALDQSGAMKVGELSLTNISGNTSLAHGSNQIAKLGVINAGAKNFSITNTAALTQTGALTANTLSVTNSASTTLNNASNAIANLGAIEAAGQSFALTNTVAMAQTGIIKAGTLSVSNTAFDTDLSSQANLIDNLGTINAAGHTFSLKNNQALTQTGTITADTLVLNNTGGASTLTQANKIGTLGNVTSTAGDFALTNAATPLTINGTLNASGKNITIDNGAAAITVGTTSVTATSLTLSTTGGIGQSGKLTETASMTTTFNAGASAISLTDSANQLKGAVKLNNSGDNAVALTNDGALELGASSVGKNTLTIIAEGNITQSGAITQAAGAGVADFNAKGNAITLDAANVFTGAVNLSNSSANAVELNNAGALQLGTLSVGTSTLKITSNGALTQTGTISQAGAGAVTIDAGAGAITLTQANVLPGTVTLANTGANDVQLTTAGNLTLAESTVGQDLTLTAGGNLVTTTTVARDLSLTSGGLLSVGKSTVTKNLALKAGANISQSGEFTVTGTTTAIIKDAIAGVNLSNSSNVFTGGVTITAEGTGQVQDVGIGSKNLSTTTVNFPGTLLRDLTLASSQSGFKLSATQLSGNLSVTTNGDITQTGVLEVPGTTYLNAGAGAIALDSFANKLTQAVSFNNTGTSAVALKTAGALLVGTSNVGSGVLSLTSGTGAITQSGVITQADAGTVSLNAGANAITLELGNDFKGPVGFATTGNVELNDINALQLGTGTLASGSLKVTAAGPISQNGAITQTGAGAITVSATGDNSVSLNAENDFVGAVSVTNTGNNAIVINDKNSLVLGNINSGLGSISITTHGALSQSGAITQSAAGAVSINTDTGAIALIEPSNTILGALSLKNSGTANVEVKNNAALLLGTSTVGTGTLALTGKGISQNGPLKQGANALATSFNAGSNNLSLLDTANEITGGVTLTTTGTGNIALTNNKGLSLSGVSMGTGTLTLDTSTGGDLTQTGAIVQANGAGLATFKAGAHALNLGNTDNVISGSISLNNSDANNVALYNKKDINLAASSLGKGEVSVISEGAITQSGIQSGIITQAAGALKAYFQAKAGSIDLSGQANDFTGPVALTTADGFDAKIKDANSLVLSNGTIGNDLTVLVNGNVSQSGTLKVKGTASFTTTGVDADISLADKNNEFVGNVTIAASGGGNVQDVTVSNATSPAANPNLPANLRNLTLQFNNAPLSLPTTAVSGNLSAIAGGAITQTGTLNVGNNADFDSKAGISFNKMTVGNNLTALAVGEIKQTDAISVTGLSSFTAGANKITLDTPTNAFTGAVSLNNSGDNAVALKNGQALIFGASTIGSGTFDVTANGAITQLTSTGIVQEVTNKATSITATTGEIKLDQANTLGAPLNLSTASPFDVAVTSSGAVKLGTVALGRNLSIDAGGNISQTNALVTGGAATFTITGHSGDVLLDHVDNNFTGKISVIKGIGGIVNNVSVRNNNGNVSTPDLPATGVNDLTLNFPSAPLVLPQLAIGGKLSVTTGGKISQSGTLSVGSTSSFTAGQNEIKLDKTDNVFTGAVSLSNSGNNNVTLNAGSAIILGKSDVGIGTLTISGNGISQLGALTQAGPGAVTISAGANDLILDNTDNDFVGAVGLTATGTHNVAITDKNALTLGTSASGQAFTVKASGAVSLGQTGVGQNLIVNAGANISQTGILTVAGTSLFKSSGTNANIALASFKNDFTGAVTFDGSLNDVELRNASSNASLPTLPTSTFHDLTLLFDKAGVNLPEATVTMSGKLTVTAGGDINAAKTILLVDGLATFDAGGFKINVSNVANDFKSTVILKNSGANSVAISDVNGLAFGASTLGSGALTVKAGGAITQVNGGIVQEASAATASFTAGTNEILLDNVNNNLTGEIALSNNGNKEIVLKNLGAVKLATSSVGSGKFTVEAGGAITQSGALTQEANAGATSFSAGANAITLTQANNFTGEVMLANSGTANTAITDKNDLRLAASTVAGGTLDIKASGNITQSGALKQVGGKGAVSIDAGAGGINLATLDNDFIGSVTLKTTGGSEVKISDANALDLAASNLGIGALTVTAGGAISQSGALIQVANAGTATFDAGANTIDLSQKNNDFTGAVVLKNSGKNDVILNDANALILGESAVGQGKLTVTSRGALTQAGSLIQAASADDASFDAGAAVITLNKLGNQFTGNVILSNSGTNNVTLANATNLRLGNVRVGAGSLIIDAAGTMTQNGSIVQAANAGAVTLSAGANAITLNNTGNDFTGLVNVTSSGSAGVTLFDASDINLGNVTMGTGSLTVSALASINQGGVITQNISADKATFTASSGIKLAGKNELTGVVSLNNGTGSVELNDVSALLLGTSNTGSSKLTVTTNGEISQTGAITQSGSADTASFSSGAAAIRLTNAGNEFIGAVSVNNTGTNDAAITDSTALVLGTSTVGKDLNVIAGGHITQSGILTVPGDASFTMNTATLQNVALASFANDFAGKVTIANGTGSIADVELRNAHPNSAGSGILILPDRLRNLKLTYDQSALAMSGANLSGKLEITAGGAITQTGPLIVAGTSSFNAGANAITLDKANDFGDAVALINTGANNVVLNDINALNLGKITVGSGTLKVTAGAISQSDSITQESQAGKASFNAGGNSITLGSAENEFTGAVSLTNTGKNNVVLRDKTALELGESNLGTGTLSVTAGGNLTQSGAIKQTAAAQSASFTVGANSISLNHADNDFTGPLLLSNSGSKDITVRDANGLNLGLSSVGSGALNLTSNGTLEQSGPLTQEANAGQLTLNAGAGAINFTQSSNTITGAVSLNNSGANNASISNTRGIVLANSTLGSGQLSVNALGPISQTGPIKQANNAAGASFSAGANTINLSNTANELTGGVSLNNTGVSDVNLVNSKALILASSNLGNGNLTITAAGAISQTGPLTQAAISGAASQTTINAGASTISLTSTGNDFTLPLALNGGDTQVTDKNGLVLAKSAITGSLSLNTTGGNLTQVGSLTVRGATTINAGGGDVSLTQATNDLTLLDVSAANATVVDINELGISGDVSGNLTSSSKALNYGNLLVGGKLTANAGGAISQSAGSKIEAQGAASLNAGTNAITLGQANDFNSLEVKGASAVVNDINAVNIVATTTGDLTTTSGALSLTTSNVGGNLTSTASGALNLTGSNVGGTLTVDAIEKLNLSGNKVEGSVKANSKGTLTLADSTVGVDLTATSTGAANLAARVGGNLTANAGGALSISTNAGKNLTATSGAALTLTNSTIGGSVIADANEALNLSGSTITGSVAASAKGALSVAESTVGADLTTTSTGASNLAARVGGNLKATSGAALTLTGSTIGGNLLANANEALSLSGSAIVGSLTANSKGTLTLIESSAGGDVNATSTGASNLAARVGGNLTATSGAALTIAASAGGNLTASSGAELTLTGSTVKGSLTANSKGTLNLAESTVGVDLTATSIGASSIAANVGGNLTANSGAALTLGASTVGGNVAATASGAVAQSGALAVKGKTNIAAGANSITLLEANDFQGTVSVSNTGANDVKLKDVNAMVLGDISTEGNLSVAALGITQAEGKGINVGRSTSLNGGVAGIVLENPNNDFVGSVTLTSGAGAVAIADANALQLAASTLGGSLKATTAGAITQSGALNVSGASSFDAGVSAITLGAANSFGGKVSVKGGVTQVVASSALDAQLNTSAATTLTAGTELSVAGEVKGGTLTTTAPKTFFGVTSVEKDLLVNANGAVTQKGGLKVGGTTTIKGKDAKESIVDLSDSANDFIGKVTLEGSGKVSDVNTLSITLVGAGEVDLSAGGVLDVAGTAANLNTSALGNTNFGDLKINQSLNILSLGGEIFVLDGKKLESNTISFTLPKTVNLGSLSSQFKIENVENLLVLSGGNGFIQIPLSSKVKTNVKVALGVGCIRVNNSGCVNGSAVISGAISAVQSAALSSFTSKLQREDASTKKLTYGFAGDLQQVQSYPHEGGLEIRTLPSCRTGNTIGSGAGGQGLAVNSGVDCGSASNGDVQEKIRNGFAGDLQQSVSMPHQGAIETKGLPTCATAQAAQAGEKGVSLAADAAKCLAPKAEAPVKPLAAVQPLADSSAVGKVAGNAAGNAESMRGSLAAK